MSDRNHEQNFEEAQRRAEEARQNWRRAREEMRQAFRRARAEGAAGRQGDLDEGVQEMADTARDFAGEVADEARRFAEELWRGARHDFQHRWRDQWHHAAGKDWHNHWVFGGRRFRQWASGGEEVNPLVAALLSRGGGLLSLYVLHLLAEQPRHGNDIMKQIEARTLGAWTSNPGAIYPLLSLMEEKGLVQSRWEDPDKRTRRHYQISEEGRQELARLRQMLRPKAMEAIEVLHALYDDLYPETGDGEPGGGADLGATPGETSGDTVAEGQAETPPPAGEEQPRQSFSAPAWPPRRFGRFFGRGPAHQAWAD
ncbi:MAG: PadR family transcriptional regulator [Chloroflexota bacterium]